ncbi:Cordon-bleu protein-like 1 [Bienertia sinuspersici]
MFTITKFDPPSKLTHPRHCRPATKFDPPPPKSTQPSTLHPDRTNPPNWQPPNTELAAFDPPPRSNKPTELIRGRRFEEGGGWFEEGGGSRWVGVRRELGFEEDGGLPVGFEGLGVVAGGFRGGWGRGLESKVVGGAGLGFEGGGYWPKEAFGNLAYVANQAEWGGETNSGPLPIQTPEMGNGRVFTPGKDTRKVWNCEEYYNVKDAGYVDAYVERLILYGGPWST